MFRLSGVPQIDAAEEKRRVRESVKTNVFSFILLCSAIRLGELPEVSIMLDMNLHHHIRYDAKAFKKKPSPI